MKKISILGLMLSLFAVFALSSCSKEKVEPKSHIGKIYASPMTYEKDYNIGYVVVLDNENELYIRFAINRNFSYEGVYRYNYTYDEATRKIQLTKFLSAKDVKGKFDKEDKDLANPTEILSRMKLSLDKKLEQLTLNNGREVWHLNKSAIDDFEGVDF